MAVNIQYGVVLFFKFMIHKPKFWEHSTTEPSVNHGPNELWSFKCTLFLNAYTVLIQLCWIGILIIGILMLLFCSLIYHNQNNWLILLCLSTYNTLYSFKMYCYCNLAKQDYGSYVHVYFSVLWCVVYNRIYRLKLGLKNFCV